MHVYTRERDRGRAAGHAAGQGSTFASRVHIIPGMFAKSTCRRKMNGARKQGGRTLSRIGIRARCSVPLFSSFFQKKKKIASASASVQNAICKERISLSCCRIFSDSSFYPTSHVGRRDMAEKLRFVAILYGRRRWWSRDAVKLIRCYL